SVPYYLYCLRLRRLVLIFVNPLYHLKDSTPARKPISTVAQTLPRHKPQRRFHPQNRRIRYNIEPSD
ncbi:hypothetical protein, partial [Neisseria meningitidis]